MFIWFIGVLKGRGIMQREILESFGPNEPVTMGSAHDNDQTQIFSTRVKREEALVLSQLGFGNCLRKRLRLLPFFRSVDVGGWQPWDENGMWSGWKGKNETSWND